MHIDHHLQSRIVDALWDGERSFSELKPSDIENSLFMYHLRKLITRGIVAKGTRGYELTPEGTRWAHTLDDSYRTPHGIRMLVQLFVVRDNQLLVSKRRGVAAVHLNTYLLPGALHAFGTTADECADILASRLEIDRGALLTQVETILPSEQLHVVSDIYAGSRRDDSLPGDDSYTYHWMALDSVASMDVTEAGALPMIAKKFLNGTLASREYFK